MSTYRCSRCGGNSISGLGVEKEPEMGAETRISSNGTFGSRLDSTMSSDTDSLFEISTTEISSGIIVILILTFYFKEKEPVSNRTSTLAQL